MEGMCGAKKSGTSAPDLKCRYGDQKEEEEDDDDFLERKKENMSLSAIINNTRQGVSVAWWDL